MLTAVHKATLEGLVEKTKKMKGKDALLKVCRNKGTLTPIRTI